MDRNARIRFIYGTLKTLKLEEEDRYALVENVTGKAQGIKDCTDMQLLEIVNRCKTMLPNGKIVTNRQHILPEGYHRNEQGHVVAPPDVTKAWDDAFDRAEKQKKFNMKKKLISCAYTMGWATPGDWKKALEKIDAFTQGPKSLYKKAIDSHTVAEMAAVVSQFDQMVRGHYKGLSQF